MAAKHCIRVPFINEKLIKVWWLSGEIHTHPFEVLTAILHRHWVTLVSLKAWCWMPVKWNPYVNTGINKEFLARTDIQDLKVWSSYLCLEGLETSSRRLQASSSCARVLGGGRGGMAGSWTKGCAGWWARRCPLLPPPPQVCVRVGSKQWDFFTVWVL